MNTVKDNTITFAGDEPYRLLANAIIVQAVNDYKKAESYLKRHPHTLELDEESTKEKNKQCKAKMQRLEKILQREDTLTEVIWFLKSQWGYFLSPTDNEMIIDYLTGKECGNDEFKRIFICDTPNGKQHQAQGTANQGSERLVNEDNPYHK